MSSLKETLDKARTQADWQCEYARCRHPATAIRIMIAASGSRIKGLCDYHKLRDDFDFEIIDFIRSKL